MALYYKFFSFLIFFLSTCGTEWQYVSLQVILLAKGSLFFNLQKVLILSTCISYLDSKILVQVHIFGEKKKTPTFYWALLNHLMVPPNFFLVLRYFDGQLLLKLGDQHISIIDLLLCEGKFWLCHSQPW